MLILAKNLQQLSFSALMGIYIEGNLEKARDYFSDLPEYAGLQQAEQDFYQFLKECFFKTPGAVYAVWEEEGKYVSAVRWELYSDGVLISALETEPKSRRKGYASLLLNSVLENIEVPVYSHVHKQNVPSLAVHKKCGFEIISDCARYLDGSVNSRACTLCRKKPRTDKRTACGLNQFY